MISSYPGTPQHQALLQAIVSRYQHDPRILSVVIFGSLVRGNWDRYSDIDCDIIIADDVTIDILAELASLDDFFGRVGEQIAFIIPNGEDEGDIQLCSLMQISIRYHPLAQTSPAIIDHMRVLTGRLDPPAIVSAGEANRVGTHGRLNQSLDMLVRYAVVANICLQRQQVWTTHEILGRMRGLLMDLFAYTHGGKRAYQFFDHHAPLELRARLGRTLPASDMASLRQSYLRLLDLLEEGLESITNGNLHLTDAHRVVLGKVREATLTWHA